MNSVALVITKSRSMSALLRVTSDSTRMRAVVLDLILRILVMIVGEYLRQKHGKANEAKATSHQDDQQSI